VAEWLRIDAGGRWDAIALLHDVWDKHAFLVQDGSSHWELHLQYDGAEGVSPGELELRLRRWLASRSVPATSVLFADGTRLVVRGSSAGSFARPMAAVTDGGEAGR